jgi:hypothetical protein
MNRGRECVGRFPLLLAAAAAIIWCAGCAGYRLGPTNEQVSGAQSIFVAWFENQTIEPRLPEAVAHAMRRTIQLDGTHRLSSRTDADLVMEGALVRYERSPVAFQRSDILSVQEYEVRLIGRVQVKQRVTGRKLLDREVTARTAVSVGQDLGAAERQALPLLAEDFARNATTFLVEGTW